MAILSTGPIENSPAGGVRPTQLVTIKFDNRDPLISSVILVEGYVLNGTRTLYAQEEFSIAPNEVITKNYFADLNAFEFVFTIDDAASEVIQISAWGKKIRQGSWLQLTAWYPLKYWIPQDQWFSNGVKRSFGRIRQLQGRAADLRLIRLTHCRRPLMPQPTVL
ncbi:hypothetical protein ACFSQ7_29090 [Paenibacillus rhizoplanae]